MALRRDRGPAGCPSSTMMTTKRFEDLDDCWRHGTGWGVGMPRLRSLDALSHAVLAEAGAVEPALRCSGEALSMQRLRIEVHFARSRQRVCPLAGQQVNHYGDGKRNPHRDRRGGRYAPPVPLSWSCACPLVLATRRAYFAIDVAR
jgi:hypothetical protein